MSQLAWLEPDSLDFPPTDTALEDPNGLLAAGTTLSCEQLIAAYQQGIFPWFEDGQPVLWWSPSPRLVLLPEELHISKSMKKLLKKSEFEVTTDLAFDEVIHHCAAPRPDQQGTWITEEISEAYQEMHARGLAHSVEVWQNDELVGGLYGIAMGQIFFGESMFALTANASKYGFIYLIRALKQLNYKLIDCQVHTNHLASLGAKEIPRHDFENYLLNFIKEGSLTAEWPKDLSREQPINLSNSK
ncbi:MAG: leucyl/phenylalanyl-tRNA--protein transferase [Cellvibrionaceae bacterium]|nr:leucyl/phenylalanyl-tRNA--protein transferase [Cellvibrionaceae bacterium]|tara:strand:- start:6452 stop:7183 length:732 start_codon:yes stop_codon:yes gene_type:complete